jgi:hypothetical protein
MAPPHFEIQSGGQFSSRKIVSLVYDPNALRGVRHPDSLQANVASERIGSECRSLDFSFGMLSGEPAEQGHAGIEWIVANLQAYDTI